MALLLVMLLIVMVAGAGVYASQNAALDIRSAGYTRQAAQTHYIAESGVVASLGQLKTYCNAYVQLMVSKADCANAPSTPGCPMTMVAAPTSAQVPNPATWSFYLADFAVTGRSTNALGLFQNATTGSGGRVAGSLGNSDLAPGFATTANLLGIYPQTQYGFDVGGGTNYSPPLVAFEIRSNGRTQLQNIVEARNNSLSTEEARVVVVVPCL